MNKYVLSFLFLLAAVSVWGQSKSKVYLVQSTTMSSDQGVGGNRIIKVHNGVFKQDNSTLTSDSAYFYPDLNMVDAFSRVVINQGDTVHIYADKLNYAGNTKTAILTNHVIMVEKDATLTTDNFTYNTATRIGTYTDGGKLVNKGNTLTSKNGYYFAFTRDAYFRYDVVCTTPDAVIKTDTMRYNSGSRITYFYGPTIITGKDKDVLYTENGTYNTVSGQAFFGKRNLYVQKTKSLRGDSLFYDRQKGYGRAVKHVTFTDTQDRITIKGDLGEYFKANEQAVITQNAYMTFVTEDSTAIKTNTDSLLKKKPATVKDSIIKKIQAAGNALLADKKLTLKAITDSVTKKLPANISKTMAAAKKPDLKAGVNMVNKTLQANSKSVPPGNAQSLLKTAAAAVNKNIKDQPVAKVVPSMNSIIYKFADTIREEQTKRPNIRYDSLFFAADTLKTQMMTFKDFKILKQKQYEATHIDTSIKIVKREPSVVYKKAPKFITLDPMPFPQDTSFIRRDYFGKPTPPVKKAAPKMAKVVVAPKKTAADSVRDKRITDSLALHAPKPLSDTSRIRIVSGYNHAKLFKSDLQAKADSMFYSSSDSTIRMYDSPMIWTQASQLSGDTINLQMRNKKLNNLDMYPAAFIVNLEKNDSTHYNQAGGKRMHGTFKNSKLNTFAIIGNAETIYFKRDTVKNIVTDMTRTFSGKAYAKFNNGEVTSNAFAEKYEAKALSINKVKEEDKILKGFIWKPKERPVSKASILSGYFKTPAAKKSIAKLPATVGKPGTPTLKKQNNVKAVKDTLSKPAAIKFKTDSIAKPPVVIKSAKDSVIKDTSNVRRSMLLK